MKSKLGQVTIFIIVGVLLVSMVIGFFMFKDKLFGEKIPVSIEPIYKSFLSCLEAEVLIGADVLGSQGGYIELPSFEPGSEYMPFSNQLNFLGNPIPYWYYVSGNNVQKEQVPSKSQMGKDLGNFIEERILDCKFTSYYEEGFVINQGEPEAEVRINADEIVIDLKMSLNINKGEDSALIQGHKIVVDSMLGKLYDSAMEIYNREQKSLFLEEYAVDTLRLYAPVDGVELTCSPKIWNANKVFDELGEAIEANTLALKVKGGDYSLSSKEDEYFVVDVEVSEDVRFINSRNWSNSFSVNPSDEAILMAKPIGNQPGLGVLGFCYAPYHFVYDVRYPVLVQISRDDELFQFPIAVVLQGNSPREALDVSGAQIGVPELCEYKNNNVNVNIFDTNLNPVDADVSYECFGSSCNIGKTSNGKLSEGFPQCANGYVLAKAEGFADAKYLHSTTEEGSVDIILDKVYELDVDLKLDRKSYGKDAIISFVSDKVSKTVVYPEQKSVKLSEGQYEIFVSIYKNSSLKLEATTQEQCMDIPQSGLGGLFGVTEEKCFTVEIPSQIISNALAGGGKENYYILESELQDSNMIEINAESLAIPKSIEELQNNYIVFETKGLDVMFK